MARIELNFLGKPYPIRCQNGEEERVQQLASYVEERLERLAVHEQREGNSVNDTRLMMLACLVMADEVFELKMQRSRLGHPVEDRPFELPLEPATPTTADPQLETALETTLVAVVEDLAGRLEQLATKLAS